MDQAGPNRPARAKRKLMWLTDFVCRVNNKEHFLLDEQREQSSNRNCECCKQLKVAMELTRPKQQVSGETSGNATYRVKCPDCEAEYTVVRGLKKHAVLIDSQCYDHATHLLWPFCTQ